MQQLKKEVAVIEIEMKEKMRVKDDKLKEELIMKQLSLDDMNITITDIVMNWRSSRKNASCRSH